MEGIDSLLHVLTFNQILMSSVVVLSGWMVVELLGRFLDDLGERFTERRLALMKVKAVARFAIYFAVGVVLVASVISGAGDAQAAALTASAGFAFGFAFKDVLASLITGVLLLVDQPFQVGDRIAFGDYYGEVMEIGLRSVRLATLDDNLVTIPNSKFLNDPVASANAGELHAMVVVEFYIGAAEDFYEARQIVAEAAATSRYVFLDKKVVTLVSDQFLGERFVTVVKLKAYVFDVRYEKPFASDVTERVKRAFRTAGIITPDRQYRDLDMFGQETKPEPEVQ